VRPYLGGVPTDSLAIRFGVFQLPQGQQHLKETTMKQLLIALTLVAAFAAPAAMAEGFPNPYQSTQDR